MNTLLLISALFTSQAAGAQTPQTFLERFDDQVGIRNSVQVLLEAASANGWTGVRDVATKSANVPGLSESDRIGAMLDLFDGVKYMIGFSKENEAKGKFPIGTTAKELIVSELRYGLDDIKKIVESPDYEKNLRRGPSQHRFYESFKTYVSMEPENSPPHIIAVRFRTVPRAGDVIQFFLCFRTVEIDGQKKSRLEFIVPEVRLSVTPASAGDFFIFAPRERFELPTLTIEASCSNR